ncbi:MAG: substrate-binding domain-containing protein, partial [Desulfobacterales bacterium]|nr:substrate-binding domain-containing protein [Desulfobacterales bacterium]
MLFTARGIARDRRLLFMPLARLRLTHLMAVLLLAALQLPVTASAVLAADYQGTLKIGGTGAAIGTITQVAAAFQKKNPGVRVLIPPSLGSTGGIKALMAGALDVGLSSRPLTEAERGHGLVVAEYARTPLLLVTSHKGAEVSFTLKQIASLYNGEIPSYPDGTPIRLIMRPEVEIDLHLIRGLSPEMDKAVQKAQSREGMIVAVNDQDNGDTLERIRGAIGWMTLAQLISEGRQLTPLPFDNFMPSQTNFPSQANFAPGIYPLFRTFIAVSKAQPTPLVKSFLAFLTSAEGREILVKNG